MEFAERNIEGRMLECRHFNGIQNEKCEAGVRYDDVVPIPCIGYRPGETQKHAECSQKSCWTREEAIQHEEEAEQKRKKLFLGLHAAREVASKLGLRKGNGGYGNVECPICHGNLRFSVVGYNGHLWGKCDTPGCLSWMQ